MLSVVKSKLLVNKDTQKLNESLQKTIDAYRAKGLTVRIENSYSATENIGGESSGWSTLYDYVLVVGYEKGD